MIVEQLLRIDGKADIFQQWRNDMIKAGQTPMVSEDEFMVSKLLQTRVPELIREVIGVLLVTKIYCNNQPIEHQQRPMQIAKLAVKKT